MDKFLKSGILNVAVFILTMFLSLQLTVQPAQAGNAKANQNKNIRYAVNYKKLDNEKGHVVYINDKQAVWLLKDQTGDRAKIISQKLDTFLKNTKNYNSIKPFKEGRNTVVRGDGKLLFTADKQTADAFGVSTHELAFVWANSIRATLNQKPLKHDYSSVVSRSSYNVDFQRRYLGQTIYGIASWYGAPFHGQRSSDGSRYNKYEFTAAHKTLPFGTLIKVTNLKNDKSCVVRITDRGPYVGDRVIDLSRAVAREIGSFNSGLAKVKLEIVGKY